MPLTDEEAAELKRDIAEAKRAAKEAKADQDRMGAAYQADMRIIGDKLFKPEAPKVEAVDDDEEMTVEKVRRIAQESVQQPAAAIGQSLLSNARSVAALTIPDFGRYAAEVDQLVSRALQSNPQAITNPDLYRQSFEVVRLSHHDEILKERTDAEVKRRLRDDYGVEVDEEEGVATTAPETESASTPPAKQAEAQRRTLSESPTAPSTAGRTLPPLKTRRSGKLTEEQDFVNQRLGMKDSTRFDEYADPRYSPDILGLNGRDRV